MGFSLFQIIRSPPTKCQGGFGKGLRGSGSDDRGDGGGPSPLHLLQLGLKSLDLCTGTATERGEARIFGVGTSQLH